MDSADANLTEPNRLRVLQQTSLVDQPPEAAFDRLTRLAAKLIGVPIALISLVDKDRQFFKSQIGLPPVLAIPRQTPLSHSFCKYVVLTAEPLVVSDSRLHPLLKDNPVIEHGVVAYAGIPLITEDGLVLGSFCAIDSKPRDWTEDDIDNLRDFAAATMTEIELRRSNEFKDRFIAMLSHELRMPLSPAMMTAAALAADESLPMRVREDVQLIHRNIEHETQMIDALLDLTRISSGKLHLSLHDVDVHAILHASAGMCGVNPASKAITIQFVLQATRCHFKGDAAKLQQVFCNLLGNAIKFSKPDGRITIRTSDDTNTLVIEVIDDGAGIAASVLPHIFDSYQQGGIHVTKEFGGLGLGLAICKGIVDAHGGSISANSPGPGRGATMRVMLPSPFSIVAAAVVPVAPPALAHSGTVSILLVEDHADTLRIMTRLLRKLEHRVVTANSVASAMQAATAESFDLIISDLGLPDGTGLDLLQQLGDRRPPNGIALTGYGTEEDIQRTREVGFQRHLTKPINFADLQNAIREIAEKMSDH